MARRSAGGGFRQFEDHYRSLFPERWETLKAALVEATVKISYQEGLRLPYVIDRASLEAPRMLDVTPGMEVLDLCAAPGGKTLALAVSLNGSGRLTSNDLSSRRRRRLRMVIDHHLPQDLRKTVRITGRDGTRWGLVESDVYDRVLVDAPCSSERHLLDSPKFLEDWSPARSRNLAVRQYALLAAALETLKPGGIVVYSTCALDPRENDGVVARLVKKRGERVNLLAAGDESRGGETTPFGRIWWPDRENGAGPIYAAKLQKIR